MFRLTCKSSTQYSLFSFATTVSPTCQVLMKRFSIAILSLVDKLAGSRQREKRRGCYSIPKIKRR